MRRVVVTGLGAFTPIGNSVNEVEKNLFKGVSGSDYIKSWDTSKGGIKTRFACEVKNFDPTLYMNSKEVNRLDRYSLLAIAASEEAFRDSGINEKNSVFDELSVVWGTGIGGLITLQQEVKALYQNEENRKRVSPFFIPKLIPNIAAGHISMRFGFRGPNYSTVSACTSSANALIDSFNLIKMGKTDVVLTGGSEACVCEIGIIGFNSMNALSERNDDPKTASRPFDKNRDGFVLAEGGVAIFLEEYEHAKKRGAKIYGEMIGGGMSADAHHITAPHPEGLGPYLSMTRALKDANISAEKIDYINVHGTSTPLGDKMELSAIVKTFKDHAYKLSISATKSMTGHLLGGAGAIEFLISILAIKNQTIPPTINFQTSDPEIDQKLNLTLNSSQKRKVNTVLSNNFGFGGQNASILIQKL